MALSVARKINRETVVLLGWGRAILLQFANPLVAAAVADYSQFGQNRRGYLQRARRTVDAMLTITFGTEEQARAVVAGINAVHAQVRGYSGIAPASSRPARPTRRPTHSCSAGCMRPCSTH